MGCAASIVLLQAFRSVVQRSCPHICTRRQEDLSHEIVLQDDVDEISRLRTPIIMVEYAFANCDSGGRIIYTVPAVAFIIGACTGS